MKEKIIIGDYVNIEGDSKELWIQNYNVKVCSEGKVLKTPNPKDKKIFVQIFSIANDFDICVYVKKSKVKKIKGR